MADGINLLDQYGRPFSANGHGTANGKPIATRGGFALPSVLTTSAVYRGAYHTFLDEKYDEAMRHSRENALAMRRDCWLMALLNERVDAVLGLKWSIEVEDPKDKWQKYAADALTKAVKRTPHLRQYLRQQMQDIWYGRAACQIKWAWQDMKLDSPPPFKGTSRVLTVGKHLPVNGDKIGYQWYDEKTHKYVDVPYVRVNSSYTDDALGKAEYIYSSYGKAVMLRGSWRDRFCISTYNPEDADFFEGDLAGGINGVGVRSVLYWSWWMYSEGLGLIWDHLDRLGLGLVIVYFIEGNEESREAAEEVALNYSRRTVLLFPRPAGTMQSRTAGGAHGVEIVETPITGAEFVLKLRKDLEDKMERYMVGQSMSGGKDADNGEGLGGKGQSEFAQDTKRNILLGDADRTGEYMTGSDEEPGMVSVIRRHSFPWIDFPTQFKFSVDVEDPGKTLEAVTKAVSVGVTFKTDSIRALVPGQEKPGPDDEVVGGQQQQGQPGGGINGKPAQGIPAEEGDEEAQEIDGASDAGAENGGMGEDGINAGSDTAGFLEFLNGITGEAAPVQYARDPWDVILYAPEDWVSGTPSRGPNKGKSGWHNTKTRKWLFGEHPGVGEAKKEEGKGQKAKAKEEAGAARTAKRQADADSPKKAVDLIERLRQKPDAEGAKQLGELLGSMKVAQLQQLKSHFGLKASGVKPVLAAKIAQRALGDGPPVGGGHPAQASLAGVAKAMGMSEEDARQKLGDQAPAFEAMLAKLKGASDGGSVPAGASGASAGNSAGGPAGVQPPVQPGAAVAPGKPAAGGARAAQPSGAGTGQEVAKPTTAPKPASQSPEAQQAAQSALPGAYAAIAARNERLGGIVTVPELHDELRKTMPGLSREQFHGMLTQMAQNDALTLQVNNDPRLDPRASEGIQSPRGLLSYVVMKPVGQAPVAPNAAGYKIGNQDKKALGKQSHEMTYQELRGVLESVKTKEDVKKVAPILRQIWPDFTSGDKPDTVNDFAYGIWRMANLGDEIHRMPMNDLSARHKQAIQKARSAGEAVPSEVLADYQGLAQQSPAEKEPAAPQPAPATPAAKPAAPQPAPQPAGHPQAVLSAFKSLDKRGDNLVSLADLRDALSQQGLDRASQDAAIHALRKQGTISLSGVEGRHAVSNPAEHQRQMGAAIREGGEVLGNVAMRPGAQAASPRPAAQSGSPKAKVESLAASLKTMQYEDVTTAFKAIEPELNKLGDKDLAEAAKAISVYIPNKGLSRKALIEGIHRRLKSRWQEIKSLEI